jgi:hypothetical protein
MHLRATGVRFTFLLALLIPALLMGQDVATGGGTITGRVTDATGAIVADATVTITDTSTNIGITVTSNVSGLYILQSVKPGVYNIAATKPGFRKSVVPTQEVTAGSSLTLNFALEVGAVTETVQVQASAEAELQTLNSTMGQTLTGTSILNLPTANRDVSSLLFVQPTASPTFGGAEGNITSGTIAGNPGDQNTYLLDGGNNTSDLDGDNGTYVGSRSGVMPTPVESVEEFRVNTNNMTSDFATSAGGQVMITTKRGTNQFHGSAYDFFQGDWLNANSWSNNFNGVTKPKFHYNRFGGAVGGPMLPDFLGGKTYFYLNYEGERYPRTGPISTVVPSDLLRQGIFQIRDDTGQVVQYNLKTMAICGPNGNGQCDPRGIGISPVISQLWNKYEPETNNNHCGDKLNTQCFLGYLNYPLATNFGVARIDHDFGPKWRFFGSYRYFGNTNPTTNQVDIGGLVSGDTKGVPASQSSFPVEPRYLVGGLTTTITPSLNNDFHYSYTKNFWQWDRLAASVPQIPGIPASLNMPGDAGFGGALIPMNVDTQQTRPRLWDGHDYSYRDSLNWLRGTHLFQFGGEYFHQWFHFDRYDNVVGGLTQMKYLVGNSGIDFTADNGAYLPTPCSSTITTNCLPNSSLGTYESYYAMLAGMVQSANMVATRTGAQLNLNPPNTPVKSYAIVNSYSLYFSDAWRIKPNLTLNYGLNWMVQMPPHELNGAEDVLVDSQNQIVNAQSYLATRLAAAQNGQNYNPLLGFSPVGIAGGGSKYPYQPFWGEFSPRVSLAWNPDFGDSWLSKVFGHKNTVIRAGYGRFYTKNLGIDQVSTPVLGDGFLQPASCVNPSSTGACAGSGSVTPATAFRIGPDGNASPFPALTPTLPSPVIPCTSAGVSPSCNSSSLLYTFFLDPKFKPGSTDQVDFSIQRELKGNIILEVGYVGMFSRNLFNGLDMNAVPWMMKMNGQTFAQAYDNLNIALRNGQTPATQPFLEAALKGSSYCTGYSSCTAAAVGNDKGNIVTESVTNFWQDMDSSFVFGPALISSNQATVFYGNTSTGIANYNALVITAQKRMSSGLTLNANFTMGRALGTQGINQAYTLANLSDPWNPGVDYGNQFFDRKAVFNLLATYNLPFGKGQRWANSNPVAERALGGWSLSPIFSFASGLPLAFITGSFQEFGNGYVGDYGCGAVPLSGMSYNNSAVTGVAPVSSPAGELAINNDASNGGTNMNLFSSSQLASVFNNFRPALVGIDGRCGGAGVLRGQARWNLDLGLTKDTRINDRLGFQIYAQAFNVLNHMQWTDPNGAPGFLDLQDPGNFGALTGQYNSSRFMQVGLRIRF